jgi:hypothetical protein
MKNKEININLFIFRISAARQDSQYPRSVKKKLVDFGSPPVQCA